MQKQARGIIKRTKGLVRILLWYVSVYRSIDKGRGGIAVTDRICERCLDAVIYCTCYMGEDRELTSSGEFRIIDGSEELIWNPSNRMLSGSERMKKAILAELSDHKETICDVGTLWMEEREPIAVAFTAECLGYELSGDVPEWGFVRD